MKKKKRVCRICELPGPFASSEPQLQSLCLDCIVKGELKYGRRIANVRIRGTAPTPAQMERMRRAIIASANGVEEPCRDYEARLERKWATSKKRRATWAAKKAAAIHAKASKQAEASR